MGAVAKALYAEPVLFLGAVSVVLASLAAADVVTGWIPVATLALVTYLQRQFVSPRRVKRRP